MSPPFSSLSLSLFLLPLVHTIPPKHPPQDPPQTLLLPDAHLKMDRSANAILQDSTDISPKDSASNPRPRSRAIKNVGTAITDDGPWSKKLRLLDTPQICYHQRALAEVIKWLLGPAFDMPPPNPPFSDNKEQYPLKNRLPAPNLPSTRPEHGHNDTGKRAPEGIANYAMITLAFFAFLLITIVVTMATTIVLIIYLPCLIKKKRQWGRKRWERLRRMKGCVDAGKRDRYNDKGEDGEVNKT